MMSNPPSSLQLQQQRLHRRQNSTPIVAFEAMKVTNLPPRSQRQVAHRRGQSFDQSRSPIRRQQTGNTVSIANIGSNQGQQILREAQHRIVRPGQQQIEISNSPQCGVYTTTSTSLPGSPYENMSMNTMMQNPHDMPMGQSPYFMDMNMSMQGGFPCAGLDENNQHYFQNSHFMNTNQSVDFDERRMSQPGLRVQTELRPHTPAHQIQTAHFPLTPPVTQQSRPIHSSKSLQASPVLLSPFPVPMQRGQSLQGIIEHAEFKPKQQRISASPTKLSFEMAEIPVPEGPMKPSKKQSEATAESESTEDFLSFFDETGGEATSDFRIQQTPILASTIPLAGSQSPGRPALSPRRMSISDLNLDPGINASIEETNVTLDDIAQFIEGPDPVDNKWICKYEDCNKKFGRKENIKSHVQTHLGDRQFRCDHCQKCFVRGHDLKRHAKIHTGTKPYPCLCGNAFARHDALTRHRQRGMCIGAFDGVVKKVIKRGRPRKHRPDMDDRLDKAARTRGHTHSQFDQYASSASSCSISSWGSPPTETLDALSLRGNSPFDDMALFSIPQHGMTFGNVGFPPDIFSFTPPASPGYSTGNKPSPVYRSLTPTDLGDIPHIGPHTEQRAELPVLESLPLMTNSMTVQHSQHSLPSLSHSSSSPAADVLAFDFSDVSSSSIQQMPMKLEVERNDFDNFLDYGGMEMGLDPGSDGFFTNN